MRVISNFAYSHPTVLRNRGWRRRRWCLFFLLLVFVIRFSFLMEDVINCFKNLSSGKEGEVGRKGVLRLRWCEISMGKGFEVFKFVFFCHSIFVVLFAFKIRTKRGRFKGLKMFSCAAASRYGRRSVSPKKRRV